MFRGQLDTARCHTGTDPHRADLHWFIAFPHHQPLWVGANLSLAEQGGDMPPSALLSNCTPGWSNLIPDRWIRLTVVSPTFDRQGRVVDLERFLVRTRARHPLPDQLVISLHEPVSSLVLIEQGMEFRDEA